jgi:tetratricopeptide (TPR) repeat protein
LDAGSGAWILLAEGIINYFSLDLEKSFDKLRRSLGIGKSASISSVIPLSNAWLSHIYFHKGDYEKTMFHLQESIYSAEIEDHSSRCRSAMVASIFYGFSNLPDIARKWSHRARLHATAEGDEASLAALLFNITVFRINESRLADSLGFEVPEDYQRVVLELESSLAFDDLAQGAGLPGSPGTLRAHTYVIEKKFERAIAILKSILAAGIFAFNRASVQADLAFAYASIGKIEEAQDALKQTLESIFEAHDPDDLAFVYARISGTHRLLGNSESGLSNAAQAEFYLNEYRSLQGRLQALASGLPDPDSLQ